MTTLPQRSSALLFWSASLGATAILGSYAFACVFPFAALATIAALTLPLRRGLWLIAAVWLVNQVVGFTFRGYPHEADTVAWGIAIGVAAVTALIAARAVVAGSRQIITPRAAAALAGAFIAYEGVLFAFALIDGGLETFSLDIVGKIAANDLGWFAGLVALRTMLTGLAPRVFDQGRARTAGA